MRLSAKTGVALAITALSLVVTVGAGASGSADPVDAWVMHCCTAYSEAGPSTSVTTDASTSDTVEPADTRLISCCTAYSEAGPSTSVTTSASTSDTVEPADAWVMHCCTAYSEDVPSRHATSHILRHAASRIGGPRRDDETASQPDRAERDRVGLVAWTGERPGECRVTQYGGSTARVLAR